MSFKYERLPNICPWCGKLMHMDKECPIWETGKHALKDAEQQFGSWMRVVTPNLARESVVRVAGLKDDDSETASSEQLDDVVKHENPEAGEDVVLSSETDGSN